MKSVSTPGEDQKIEREEADLEDLGPFKASEYRQIAARVNFMTLDRHAVRSEGELQRYDLPDNWTLEEAEEGWVGTFVAVHELSHCSSTRSEVEL